MKDELSKPIYKVKVKKNEYVTLRDGVKLCVDIYHPDAERGEFPALISWSPYSKEVQSLKRESIAINEYMFDHTVASGDIDFFVSRGYVVIIPDPRGIGKSEGEWYGMYSPQEQQDCYDVIEWTAEQSCCSGNVGMLGISYCGVIQPLVASLNPPHLKAIMPINLIDDLYQHAYPGGILFDRYYYFADLLAVNNGISETEKMHTPEEVRKMLKERLEDPDINVNSNFVRILDCWPPRYHTWMVDVLLHPHDEAFWHKRSQQYKNSDINIPTYMVSEYYEYGRFTDGAFNAYTDSNLNVPKKLMITQPHRALKLPYKFGNVELLRWYDHWLKGIDTGIMDEPPIKIFVMGADKFRYEYEWPISRTRWTKFYLAQNEKLRTQPEEENAPCDTFIHKPPTLYPHRWDEVAVLKYSTEPLESPIEITGPISIRLYASLDQEDGNFIAKMWDVYPDGRRVLISTGHLKASHRTLIEDKSKEYYPVNDHKKQVPVTSGEINEYVFSLIGTSNVFKEQHKIEIEIKAMDIQRSKKGEEASLPLEDLGGRMIGVTPSSKATTYNIYHDANYQSHILLPVIPETPEELWID